MNRRFLLTLSTLLMGQSFIVKPVEYFLAANLSPAVQEVIKKNAQEIQKQFVGDYKPAKMTEDFSKLVVVYFTKELSKEDVEQAKDIFSKNILNINPVLPDQQNINFKIINTDDLKKSYVTMHFEPLRDLFDKMAYQLRFYLLEDNRPISVTKHYASAPFVVVAEYDNLTQIQRGNLSSLIFNYNQKNIIANFAGVTQAEKTLDALIFYSSTQPYWYLFGGLTELVKYPIMADEKELIQQAESLTNTVMYLSSLVKD